MFLNGVTYDNAMFVDQKDPTAYNQCVSHNRLRRAWLEQLSGKQFFKWIMYRIAKMNHHLLSNIGQGYSFLFLLSCCSVYLKYVGGMSCYTVNPSNVICDLWKMWIMAMFRWKWRRWVFICRALKVSLKEEFVIYEIYVLISLIHILISLKGYCVYTEPFLWK